MSRFLRSKSNCVWFIFLCLFWPASLFGSRHGKDLPSSQNGGCTAAAGCDGTVVYLASYNSVVLTGSNFTVQITPYLWGSVAFDYSSANARYTLFDVKLTTSNTNAKLAAVTIGQNFTDPGYVTAPIFPSPVPFTPDSGDQLSFSDPLIGVDSGYTLWALGPNSAGVPNSPQEVVLVVDGTPVTTSPVTQISPTDQPFTPTLSGSNGLTSPSAAATYAVVVFNGASYELVGSLSVSGEPGPCGATNVNPAVTCHDFQSLVDVTLTNGSFADLTRVDNAPSLSPYTTDDFDTNGNDTATCFPPDSTLDAAAGSLLAIPSLNLAIGYSYTPSTDQMVDISTSGSHYQTVIDVTDGTYVTCSDSSPASTSLFQAEIPNMALNSGTSYSIYVGDYPPLQAGDAPDVCDSVDVDDNPLPCPLTSDPVLSFHLSIVPETTSTGISCSPATSIIGSQVSCTATVTDTTLTTNTPAGSVEFSFTPGSSSSATETLNAQLSNGLATVKTSSLPAASYTVTATLEPSTSQFLTSEGTTTLTVTPKVAQTITFAAMPAQPVFSTYTLTATASSGLPVTFKSATPAICTISGSAATLLATGYCGIYASQAGNAEYAAAPDVGRNLQAVKASQTIAFAAISSQPALSTYTLAATASSGLPVSFTSTTPAVCTVSGSSASLLLHGTCSIQASQAGNTDYNAAANVSKSFTVTYLTQTIDFASMPAQPALSQYTLSATASSGLPIKFTSTTPSICTISGNSASLLAIGYCGILASQAGNSDFSAATTVGRNLQVVKAAQAITFSAIASQPALSTYLLTATASSGLPISYTSTTPTVCTVSGNSASLLIHGSCTINASQAGNADYNAAANVSESFIVSYLTQAISFAPMPAQQVHTTYTLTATTSSALPITYTTTTPSICTIVNGNQAQLLAVGYCGIYASQPGNSIYSAATTVGRNLQVVNTP